MEYIIERLGHQGDGIAPGPIFIPRTLPGEVVTGVASGGRVDDPRIVTPSPDRIAPPCPHYKACGGCALQHARDEFVADWKVGVVRHALTAQGLNTEITGAETSPARSRRRAVLSGRRTKKGALVGFHGRASGVITEISQCHLLHPDLMAGMAAYQALVIAGASRKGEMALTVTGSQAGLDVMVRGGKPLDGQMRIDLAGLANQHDLARLVWEDEVIVTRCPPVQSFGTALVTPPPGAFLQATVPGEQALTRAVLRAVGKANRVADLFAGCGTFALPLAQRAEVHAVEGVAGMLAALDQGWRHAKGLKQITHATRDLFRRPLLPDELDKFDAIVIDPPRAGAEAQMVEIARANVPTIAAVSCNPVTFARDARILTDAGYRLDWVHVVDQFRWSPHVELAAQLTRPAKKT
ncbi:class I SAM-dependent RNA methyltransferase [Oceaniglobus ichthyenteri]|uniref:class I SAM-dependent RNA methyltransferase n=1 Tax=Oceaniglobus ichthyenteri TaxID=2136177 RepID=UPI000D3D7181|nr:class I SAM-dependent RNA methyltransferase [Oceaniglobus ichthyenteri]